MGIRSWSEKLVDPIHEKAGFSVKDLTPTPHAPMIMTLALYIRYEICEYHEPDDPRALWLSSRISIERLSAPVLSRGPRSLRPRSARSLRGTVAT